MTTNRSDHKKQAEASHPMLETLEREVAARKLAEEALRASQWRHAKTEQMGHFGYWERGLSKDEAVWSDETYRIFGVDPGSFTPSEQAFLGLLLPADRKRMRAALQTEQFENGPADIEYTIVRPDGAERIIHSVAEICTDSAGRPIGLVGTVHDITERKRAEEDVRESAWRYARAERIGRFGYWERDFVNGRATWSSETYRIFGVDPASFDLNPESVLGIVHPSDRQRLQSAVEESRLNGTPLDIEYWIRRADHSERAIHTVGEVRLGNDGVVTGLVGTVHDVTERKHAEEALRLVVEATSPTVGGEFLHALARNLAKALRVRVVFISEMEDATAGRVRLLALWDGADFAETFSYDVKDTPCEHVFAHGLTFFPEGLRERFPKDQWLFEHNIESYLAVPLYRADGEPVGHLGVMHDASMRDELARESILKLFAERAGAEMERSSAEERLLAQQQLLEQILRAHERDRRLIAYEIHDGIAQYATAAIMHLDAFGDRRTPSNERGEKEYARARQLMADLAREARALVSGLRPPIIDEQGIVAAIEFLVNDHTVSKDLEIEFVHRFELEHLEPLLQGTLYRIAQEALSNVQRHSGASRARVTLTQCDDTVQLEIKDWGRGFDPDRVAAGHFGLQGIRERARILRGSALIESSPDEGTRVRVKLPISLARDGEDSQLAER